MQVSNCLRNPRVKSVVETGIYKEWVLLNCGKRGQVPEKEMCDSLSTANSDIQSFHTCSYIKTERPVKNEGMNPSSASEGGSATELPQRPRRPATSALENEVRGGNPATVLTWVVHGAGIQVPAEILLSSPRPQNTRGKGQVHKHLFR